MLAQEYHRPHCHHRDQSDDEPEVAYWKGRNGVEKRPRGEQGESKNGDHAEAGYTNATSVRETRGLLLQLRILTHQPYCGHPPHGNRKRNVVQASGVIKMFFDCPDGDVRTESVHQAGPE